MGREIGMELLDANASLPHRQTSGSLGYDLATVDAERIGSGETRIVRTGFRLARDLPQGTEGLAMLILPRSSLTLKYGLIVPNSPGLIDADYSEEIGVILHNLGVDPVDLEPGTRVAQALFVRIETPEIVEESADPERSRGGFGSTGSRR